VICLGCSEDVPFGAIDEHGGHTRTEAEHDPRCQGDPSRCSALCPIPVPVHCGPVIDEDRYDPDGGGEAEANSTL